MDPIANCRFHLEREVRDKTEHGYIEFLDGKPLDVQITEIDFNKFLPKNFCSYKPQTDIEPKALVKLHATKKARYSRKFDGMCHLMVHHPWGWEVYTRRMDLATERFPEHIKDITDISDNSKYLQVGTVLVGEMVCQRNGKDDFKAISRICRSDPLEARKLIEDKECPEPIFIIFDQLFDGGKDLKSLTYDQRAKMWNQAMPNSDFIKPVDYHDVNPSTWEKVCKENDWEGFVVTDGNAIPDDKFYTFNGDPKRPKGHHKLKPINEDDVVIFAATAGSGKRLDGIGAVFLKQKHPETGKYFFCGKCGSGFNDQTLPELEKMFAEKGFPILEREKDVEQIDLQNDEGIVCQIEYSIRQPGSSKFRFPVFCRFRNDKSVSECVAQKLAPEEE